MNNMGLLKYFMFKNSVKLNFYIITKYFFKLFKILPIFIFIQIFYYDRVLANYYTCIYTNEKNIKDQINFTRMGNQVVMTGGGFNGKYQIIAERENEGIIAAKSLEIEGNFNAEIILLDFEELSFSYTSYISDKGVENNAHLDGSCLKED